MRRWYRHLVGIGRKASSQLFEGVFQSEIPRVGGRGGGGKVRTSRWVNIHNYILPLLPWGDFGQPKRQKRNQKNRQSPIGTIGLYILFRSWLGNCIQWMGRFEFDKIWMKTLYFMIEWICMMKLSLDILRRKYNLNSWHLIRKPKSRRYHYKSYTKRNIDNNDRSVSALSTKQLILKSFHSRENIHKNYMGMKNIIVQTL